jgi:hypothetical protein
MVNVGRRPDEEHTGRDFAIILGIVVVVGALVAGLGFAAASFDPFGGSGLFGPPQGALKPIPIPASACPFLRVVSATANDANHWDVGLNADDLKSWQAFGTQLAPTLASLETSLVVAIPHVPSPVASQLSATLRQVVIGRPKLLSTRSFSDYVQQTNGAVSTGYYHLARASELVGNACGFKLAPTFRL